MNHVAREHVPHVWKSLMRYPSSRVSEGITGSFPGFTEVVPSNLFHSRAGHHWEGHRKYAEGMAVVGKGSEEQDFFLCQRTYVSKFIFLLSIHLIVFVYVSYTCVCGGVLLLAWVCGGACGSQYWHQNVIFTYFCTLSFETGSLTEREVTMLSRLPGQQALAVLLFLPLIEPRAAGTYTTRNIMWVPGVQAQVFML